ASYRQRPSRAGGSRKPAVARTHPVGASLGGSTSSIARPPGVVRRDTGIGLANVVRSGCLGSTLRPMGRSLASLRTPLAALVVLILAVAIALPALAATPGPSAGSGSGAPNPTKGPKGPRADRSPEVSVTVQGLVSATKRDDGSIEITITSA